MKFYNLTFDCNNPTKQQINIPTNTDYKVGVKVTRNGKQSILAPSEVMLDALSADAEKINGYVTFTESAGDSPSYVSKTIEIDKGYDVNDIFGQTGFMTSTESVNLTPSEDFTAQKLGLAGFEIDLDSDIQYGNVKKTTEVTFDDITNWTSLKETRLSNYSMFKWANGNPAVAIGCTSGSGYSVYHFYTWKEDGTYIGDGIPAVIQPQWILTMGSGLRGTANNYYAMGWKFKLGQPYSAKFTLNENVFKSQQGDIGVAGGGSESSINFAGGYSDGTDFSFDFLTK